MARMTVEMLTGRTTTRVLEGTSTATSAVPPPKASGLKLLLPPVAPTLKRLNLPDLSHLSNPPWHTWWPTMVQRVMVPMDMRKMDTGLSHTQHVNAPAHEQKRDQAMILWRWATSSGPWLAASRCPRSWMSCMERCGVTKSATAEKWCVRGWEKVHNGRGTGEEGGAERRRRALAVATAIMPTLQ